MKTARRRSREFALQGLYQWLLSGNQPDAILSQLSEVAGYARCDQEYLVTLMRGAVAEAGSLRALLAPLLDREVATLSPIEHGILLLGAFELREKKDIPYRVVINEAIDLAREYGGTDGHKYINGVLDRLAPLLRPDEPRRGAN